MAKNKEALSRPENHISFDGLLFSTPKDLAAKACQLGNLNVVQELHKSYGAKVFKCRCLVEAYFNNHRDIVDFILLINPNIRLNYKNHQEVYQPKGSYQYVLEMACKEGNLKAVKFFSDEVPKGRSIFFSSSRWLVYAVCGKQLEVVKYLCGLKTADGHPEVSFWDLEDAITLAIKTDQAEILRELLTVNFPLYGGLRYVNFKDSVDHPECFMVLASEALKDRKLYGAMLTAIQRDLPLTPSQLQLLKTNDDN